jgi:hypothetical protein
MIMKKIIYLILIFTSILQAQAIEYFDKDSSAFNKIIIGINKADYDVNLYRSSANILKTDDNFEIIGYLKFKGIQFTASGDSLVIIDKVTDDTVATRKWMRENATVHWDNVTNKPTRITNYTASDIMIRDNLIEEVATNANAELWVNYAGYNSGTTQFRDFVIGDGKNNAIVVVDGSAATTTFNGNVSLGSNDLSLDDITSVDDISADFVQSNTATIGNLTITGTILSSTGVDVDIRPATGNFALNYTKTGDLNFYNNTTPVFSLQETGAGYFAGAVDATAYKVNGSVGTSGQAIVSNGTTGGVWATIPALTDGDKGDVVVSSSGTVWTVEAAAGLPSQSGQSGKYLTTNGTTLSWGAGTGGIATAVYDDAQENSFTASDLLKVEDDLGEVNPENARTNLGFSTSVSMTEYGYLANVTSDIQTQLNSKISDGNTGWDNSYGFLTSSSTEIISMQQDISDLNVTVSSLVSAGYQTAAQVSSAISAALSSFVSSHTSTIQYIDWGINEASMNILVP